MTYTSIAPKPSTSTSSPSPAPTMSRENTPAMSEKKKGKLPVGRDDGKKKKYINWNERDGGSDNRTPMNRMIWFFLKDNGSNLMKYTGCKVDGKTPKTKKSVILGMCRQLFQKVGGIDVSTKQIGGQIEPILHHKYKEAYNASIASGGGEEGNISSSAQKNRIGNT